MTFIIVIVGLAASLRYRKLKNSKEDISEKRFLQIFQLMLVAILIYRFYAYDGKTDREINEERISRIVEKRAADRKKEIIEQHKSLEEEATLIGKWLNAHYHPDRVILNDHHIAIYQRENKYSIIYYSKNDEIIDIDYEKEKKLEHIYFSDRIFNTETLTLIQGFGTTKDTCKKIY